MDYPPSMGQLFPCERQALYEEALKKKPDLVLEIGTWCGGGSTYQIVRALAELNHGFLHTSEVDPNFYAQACSIYHNTDLARFICLHLQPSYEVIAGFIAANVFPDLIFLDGPEDPQVAYNDLLTLEPHLKPGTVLSVHDWLNPASTKCDLIKPYVESSKNWQIYRLLQLPESVGLVFAHKV